MHGQPEDEQERTGERGETRPCGDLQRIRREVVTERGEEDRSEDGDAERGRQLLRRLKDTGRGSDLVHRDGVEDEPEELGEARASTETGE